MNQNLITTIVGRKGSGKSTLTAELIEERPRVVVLDAVGEYPNPDTGLPKRMEVVWDFEDSLKALEEAADRDKFRLSLRCYRNDDDLDLLDLCNDLEDCLIVVEEAWRFCSPFSVPDPMAKLVRFGRHRRLDQIYVSQRASSIHRDLTAQSDLIVSFRQHEPRDIAYLQSLGDTNCAARTLPDYKVICIGDIERAPAPILQRVHVVSSPQLALEFDESEGAENADESDVDEAEPEEVDS